MSWLIFAAGTLGLAVCFALLELVVRRAGRGSEITRRIAHVMACLLGLLAYALFPAWVVAVITVVFAGAMLASRLLGLLTSIHVTRRRSLGEIYLPLGVGAAALIAQDDARLYVAAVLVLGLADVAAGLTGDLLRSPRKTWRGIAVFAVVAVIVLLACGYPLLVAVLVAIAVAFVERFSSWGTDNLTIPIATALLLNAATAIMDQVSAPAALALS